jgi:hypothetical protein
MVENELWFLEYTVWIMPIINDTLYVYKVDPRCLIIHQGSLTKN